MKAGVLPLQLARLKERKSRQNQTWTPNQRIRDQVRAAGPSNLGPSYIGRHGVHVSFEPQPSIWLHRLPHHHGRRPGCRPRRRLVHLGLAAAAAHAAPQRAGHDAKDNGGPAEGSDVHDKDAQRVAHTAHGVLLILRALVATAALLANGIHKGHASAHGPKGRNDEGEDAQHDGHGGDDLAVLLQDPAAQRQGNQDQHDQGQRHATEGAAIQGCSEGRLVEVSAVRAGPG